MTYNAMKVIDPVAKFMNCLLRRDKSKDVVRAYALTDMVFVQALEEQGGPKRDKPCISMLLLPCLLDGISHFIKFIVRTHDGEKGTVVSEEHNKWKS